MTAAAFSVLASPRCSADKIRTAHALYGHAERVAAAGGPRTLSATVRRATRTVRDLLAGNTGETGEDDEVLIHLELFVASCRTMLAGVMAVRNFARPAAHALFSLVETSVLSCALRDLKSASRAGEPRRHDVEGVRSFPRHLPVDDQALLACGVALALAQLPVARLPEMTGFAYAGTFALGALSAGSPNRARYRGALRAVARALGELEPARVLRGAVTFELCVRLLADAAAHSPARRAARVVRMLEHKARYAMLHHGSATLGGRRLVEWFSDKPFRAAAMLEALYESPWIDRDDVARSPFFRSLAGRGGRMYGVFTPAELELLTQHLADRACAEGAAGTVARRHGDLAGSMPSDGGGELRLEPHDDRGRYFALLDAEQHPAAARAACEAVDEALAELAALRRVTAGAPLFEPFPYERAAVEARISALYEYQAERVRGMRLELDVEELRRFHLYFAPLALVDGCWLRGAVVDRRESDVKLLLYGVYSDEIGNGEHRHNHANLYGRLMAELGWAIASVNDAALREAAIPRIAFKAPSFLLALDLAHADYFPELLGVTLAIELSGLDGLYERMIANLESQGYSAAYWRLHVSVDNYSTGHARQSLDAVIAYMEDVQLSCGGAAAAAVWDRIWRGFLVMLYLFEIELRVLDGARTRGHA